MEEYKITMSEIRGRLEWMADTAAILAKNMRETGISPNLREREVLEAMRFTTIESLMKEAAYFLHQGAFEDASGDIAQAMEWAKWKY